MDDRTRAAFSKAIKSGEAARVVRLRHGEYLAPSGRISTLFYRVSGTGRVWSELTCTCPAASFGHPCHHRSAVQLRKTMEAALAGARKMGQQVEEAA